MFKMIFAVGIVATTAAANAAVYAPSFDGPGLDPTISVVESPGVTHTVAFGTLVISKIAGAGFSGATSRPIFTRMATSMQY